LTSTNNLRSSAEGGNFFFEPLELHLEPPDLLEELGLAGLGVRRGRLGRTAEDPLGADEKLLLPAVDQRRMDAVVSGQFVDRAVALVGGQRDLRLERCCVNGWNRAGAKDYAAIWGFSSSIPG
jgi:hypothetical protein